MWVRIVTTEKGYVTLHSETTVTTKSAESFGWSIGHV